MTRISAATPAGYATTVTLPRVYNLAYPGDALTVTATTSASGTPTATSWTVYDFTGTAVASGSWSGQSQTIGTAGSAPFNKFGWYTFKLTGPDAGDGAFGTDGGTCRFVIAENFLGIPQAPLRSSSPANVTNNLDAPLAHGLFSLGGFRTSIVAQKLTADRQHASATATGTSVTATLTGGGFNGSVTSASDVFVVHVVNGDATGMTISTAGFVQVGSTVTNGGLTIKVWRQYGAQTGPYAVTGTTTNSASHTIYVTEVQNVDNSATANGQLAFVPVTGTGATAVVSQDMTSLAPGTTEYYVLSAVVPASGTVTNVSSTTLTPYVGVGAMTGTTDSFGGGRSHSATYTLSASVAYAGFFMAFKAVSTYSSDLASGKSFLSACQTCWGQYQDPNRPYRQMTVQVLGAAAASAVTNYSATLTQTVSDVTSWASTNTPGLLAGFTARNEPQGTYSVSEAASFKSAVTAGSVTAKAFGPDYVNLGLNNVGQTDFANLISGGLYSHLDGISFHSYNMCNGDIANTLSLNRSLASVLSTGGVSSLPIFVTEGGDYTAYTPGILRARAAGTEHILDEMAREVICGIPYERHYYYYDYRTGGYDSVATWASSASGPYAGWAMHRAYARELYGKTLSRALSFGDQYDNVMLGGVWRNPSTGDGVLAVMGCAGLPAFTFAVSGATSVTVVDCFGNTTQTAVTNGTVSLTPDDRPLYVRLPSGVDANPRPIKRGVSFLALGLVTKSDSSSDSAATSTNLVKMLNGAYTNTYAYNVGSGTVTAGVEAGDGYFTTTTTFPRTIEFDLNTPASVDTVAVYFAAPYQGSGVPLAWSLAYTTDGTTWNTAQTFTVTPVSVKNYDVASDTMLDAYTNAQHYYEVSLGGAPVTVKGIRLVLTSASLGMYLSAAENHPTGGGSAGGTAQVNITEVLLLNQAANVIRPAVA